MKPIVLLITTLAVAATMASAAACPADTSLEDGPAAVGAPEPATVPTRHCSIRMAGNPKLVHLRRKRVNCETAYATRPARHRDAA